FGSLFAFLRAFSAFLAAFAFALASLAAAFGFWAPPVAFLAAALAMVTHFQALDSASRATTPQRGPTMLGGSAVPGDTVGQHDRRNVRGARSSRQRNRLPAPHRPIRRTLPA